MQVSLYLLRQRKKHIQARLPKNRLGPNLRRKRTNKRPKKLEERKTLQIQHPQPPPLIWQIPHQKERAHRARKTPASPQRHQKYPNLLRPRQRRHRQNNEDDFLKNLKSEILKHGGQKALFRRGNPASVSRSKEKLNIR